MLRKTVCWSLKKGKITFPYGSRNSISRHIPSRIERRVTGSYLDVYVQSSITDNGQKVEAIWVYLWMDESTQGAYTCHGLLASL
jgi:hypothetical protein